MGGFGPILGGVLGQAQFDPSYFNNMTTSGTIRAVPPKRVVSFGADPEVFIASVTGNLIPAWEVFGPKQEGWTPYGCGMPFWDGYQAEWVVQPADSVMGLLNNLKRSLRYLTQQVGPHRVWLRSVVPVEEEHLAAQAEEHVRFGCRPSENVYGFDGGFAGNARKLPYRFAGGHMHFGLARGPAGLADWMLHGLDCTVGLWGVLLAQGMDSPIRRQYYGLAGEYRVPAHGLEYRTLSNFWLAHPWVAYRVWKLAEAVLEKERNWPVSGSVVRAIHQCDVGQAMEELRSLYGVIESCIGESWEQALVKSKGGMEFLGDPQDLVKNWGLEDGLDTVRPELIA